MSVLLAVLVWIVRVVVAVDLAITPLALWSVAEELGGHILAGAQWPLSFDLVTFRGAGRSGSI